MARKARVNQSTVMIFEPAAAKKAAAGFFNKYFQSILRIYSGQNIKDYPYCTKNGHDIIYHNIGTILEN
jgi:hypothetical protein